MDINCSLIPTMKRRKGGMGRIANHTPASRLLSFWFTGYRRLVLEGQFYFSSIKEKLGISKTQFFLKKSQIVRNLFKKYVYFTYSNICLYNYNIIGLC